MSTDKRVGTKVPEFIDKDSKNVGGGNRDAGPYIGIVKHNADPLRAARLQVFITEFGGVETNPSHWITVGFASPYLGSARRPKIIGNEKPSDNEYDKVNHSYGMWFTPPDIGNLVLVTFVGGDTNNGYWFACIQPDISQYATPAIAGSDFLEKPKDQELAKALTNPPYPCVEFNEENKELRGKWTNFLEIPKPIHEHQVKILLKQGLEDDKVRGVITSSSQRESPSRVFGISTPGVDGPYKDPITRAVGYRKGGHTFVMDDGKPLDDTAGNKKGQDQLIRLRTAGGHQLLMNDTENVMYIGNSTGSVWIEFTGDGKIHVFSESDFSLRTKANVNIHASDSINMYATNDIKMYSGKSIQEQSKLISLKASEELKEYGGKINVFSGSTWNVQAGTQASVGSGTEIVYSSGMIYLNTKAAPTVVPQPSIPMVEHPEPKLNGIKWLQSGDKFSSTVPLTPTPLPTHEPYINHKTQSSSSSLSSTSVGSIEAAAAGNSAPQAGPAGAGGTGVKKKAMESDLPNQPLSLTALGKLSIADMTALKAQLAKSESGFDYTSENSLGYIGKYQFGVQALETHGYLKKGTWANNKSNHAVDNPANWEGTNGLTSKQAYFNAPDMQETIMDQNLQYNYNLLIRLQVITSDSDSADIAGKLAVAHLLGAGGCNTWCGGGGGADANGTTGAMYYQSGKWAIETLSPKVQVA